ncbi:hypothetical protein J0664_05835 [Rhizobium leguminosarum]|uniref:hypothetical protein n=1 Tax=Rhizobium leguminosarum TaxID=384 RepID=UPI001A934799|nr:hypothetical protein [Rhizobium leguminosarum]MBY5553770.1 hypothetical protein [Rhizobium leguminosarum]QSW24820.1 hypothetical protein J0664_05835 [Rhizobium leguminosarum]
MGFGEEMAWQYLLCGGDPILVFMASGAAAIRLLVSAGVEWFSPYNRRQQAKGQQTGDRSQVIVFILADLQ